jgi:hypothetical protein
MVTDATPMIIIICACGPPAGRSWSFHFISGKNKQKKRNRHNEEFLGINDFLSRFIYYKMCFHALISGLGMYSSA